MSRLIFTSFIITVLVILLGSSVYAGVDKITICHAAGLDGTTHFNTLNLPESAVYGNGGHFNENGTTQAGHEDDYFGPCEEATPTITSTPSATSSPTNNPTSSPIFSPTPTSSSQSTPTILPSPTSPTCPEDYHLNLQGTACLKFELGGPPPPPDVLFSGEGPIIGPQK